MCLLALAWRDHPAAELVLVANRDEFHARPAAPLAFWDDAPEICGGRDLKQGGTWLAVDRRGRLAALTNYRELPPPGERPSRGELVADYLRGDIGAAEAATRLAASADDYAGFSLLLADADGVHYLSNRDPAGPRPVAPGVHGLSNALLDEPWPKVEAAQSGLQSLLEATVGAPDPLDMLGLLARREPYPDERLPQTGVGTDMERLLSPPFIRSGSYGTRCTTALVVSTAGIAIAERRYDADGAISGETHLQFERAG